MAANGIKSEDGSSFIKADPSDYRSPSAMDVDGNGDMDDDGDDGDDVDDFEDTGELQMPPTHDAPNTSNWLVKLPKWLWEAWSHIDDDEEITLGKIRVYHSDPANKVKLYLDDIPQHHDVPKKYQFHVNKHTYNNTLVFSEKDQPGFRAWRPNRVIHRDRDRDRDNRNNQSSFSGPRGAGGGGYGVRKKRYSSGIPKQTTLAGYLNTEATLTAIEDDAFNRLMMQRVKTFEPQNKTSLVQGILRAAHPTNMASSTFGDFVNKRTAQTAKTAKKKQQEKAVRVSQEELLDLLNACFRRYRYWSLKAFRQALHQPEAYIKQVVEKIATLIRSGPFVGQYRLNPEYERTMGLEGEGSGVKEEAAEEQHSDDERDYDGKDEDDDDFEDVKMEGA